MNTIKCPKCGETFQVDESSYNAIVAQIRNEEFDKELKERESRFNSEKQSAVEKAKLESQNQLNQQLAAKDLEIEQLRSSYAQQLSEKEVKLNNLTSTSQLELSKAIHEKDSEIERLKNQLNSIDNEKDMAIDKAVLAVKTDLNKQLTCISDQLAEKKLEMEQLRTTFTQKLGEKDLQLSEITANAKSELNKITQEYETQLRLKEAEVEQYKDFKARLSTKLLGETLEKHCEIEFNKLRALGFQNAYFEKDNDARTGSKGDYIFRAYADEEKKIEIVSIMFEMKNEADMTSTKRRNEDFLKELDKDRKEKNCEYAVLVSMLEAEDELYNSGIVDMSHRFPKMYVIRPQFFIPIITLLRNAAIKSLEYKRELAEIRSQNIDITNFEDDVKDVQNKILNNYRLASDRFREAIKKIEDAIKNLSDLKDKLLLTQKHLGEANTNAENLSIKKLTKNNPTMIAKFDELKK